MDIRNYKVLLFVRPSVFVFVFVCVCVCPCVSVYTITKKISQPPSKLEHIVVHENRSMSQREFEFFFPFMTILNVKSYTVSQLWDI